MDVSIQKNDTFTLLGVEIWHYRGLSGRMICEEYVGSWVGGCKQGNGEHPITTDEAIARILSMGHTVSGDVATSEVEELRVAVRVLAAELAAWRDGRIYDSQRGIYSSNDMHRITDTDRNPIAKAAVEAAKADAGVSNG